MRRPANLLALTLAVGAVAAAPVVSSATDCFLVAGAETTDDTTDDVEACREDVWFHEAGTKVDNVDHTQETYATFDTNAPEQSVQGGAGSGVLTTSVLHQQAEAFDTRESFVAGGTFTGVLDNIVVELYMFRPGVTPGFTTTDPTGAGATQKHSVDAALYVDGFQVATLADVDAALEPGGDAAEKIRFVFRDLADTLELFDFDLEGEHDIEIRTHGTGIGSDAAVVVYDTTEVPSGMVINAPAELIAEVDETNAG